jgi:hypothetical protein
MEMLFEDIDSEIVGQVAPYRMDVVGVVSGVVILDEKRGRLNTIVMLPADFRQAGPYEVALWN